MTQRTPKGTPSHAAATTDVLDDWLTVAQAAIVAGVPISTVVEWIKNGKVEAFHFVETSTIH